MGEKYNNSTSFFPLLFPTERGVRSDKLRIICLKMGVRGVDKPQWHWPTPYVGVSESHTFSDATQICKFDLSEICHKKYTHGRCFGGWINIIALGLEIRILNFCCNSGDFFLYVLCSRDWIKSVIWLTANVN